MCIRDSSTIDFILLLSFTLSSCASFIIVVPSACVASTAITGISSISLGIISLSIVVAHKSLVYLTNKSPTNSPPTNRCV